MKSETKSVCLQGKEAMKDKKQRCVGEYRSNWQQLRWYDTIERLNARCRHRPHRDYRLSTDNIRNVQWHLPPKFFSIIIVKLSSWEIWTMLKHEPFRSSHMATLENCKTSFFFENNYGLASSSSVVLSYTACYFRESRRFFEW